MWQLVLAYFIFSWYIILISIGLIGWYGARKRYNLRTNTPPISLPKDPEGVSILRPLRGLDTNMYENLETSFIQNYPTSKFEIIFAVADDSDPCLAVVRSLIEKYPHVNARISLGEHVVGVNPKINNLMDAYRTAKFDIVWVIDSNVSVVPDTLARSVASFSAPTWSGARVGLVHHVPYAIIPDDASNNAFGTHLERAFLNTNHAKMYIALNALAIDSCVMGKSNLFRRSDIDRINASRLPLAQQVSLPSDVRGLAAVAKFAAEDAEIGMAVWHELGLAHVLSADVAANALGSMSLHAYASRRARWIRVRKGTVIAATLLEPLTESLVAGTLAAFALRYLTAGAVSVWMALLVNSLVFLVIDLDVRRVLTGRRFESWSEAGLFVMAYMARELLAFPIWVYAVCGSEIDWRGERYTMLRGGEVRKVQRRGREPALGGRGSYEPLLSSES
ncbi:glycosyltransferase family 21 protein [Serendipita vermifera MAFF 305830]|uniref:Ceramide glucosyltransferase n=1 Tax=Serendipita vermifera MAFF 305830 TaxID=933852 RepID=A0A0C3BFF8_SERVB|nr:glycosyltransferase family 21 protein [Serendipita vermifera MAFF 305830]